MVETTNWRAARAKYYDAEGVSRWEAEIFEYHAAKVADYACQIDGIDARLKSGVRKYHGEIVPLRPIQKTRLHTARQFLLPRLRRAVESVSSSIWVPNSFFGI